MRLLTDYMSQWENEYRQHVHLGEEDSHVLKLLLAAATSQHLAPRTELLWLIIIGPSSAGKTMALNPLIECKELVIARDDCTSNAMISGSDPDGSRARANLMGDPDDLDPSLIKILDGKLFLVKDLTLMMNKKDEADKFWGYMRAAYDGQIAKHTGTIGYQGKDSIRFGFIGATTDGSIEGSLVRTSRLGDRAIYVRVHQHATTSKEDRSMANKVLANRGTKHIREKQLAIATEQIFRRAIAQVKDVGPSEPNIHDPLSFSRIIDMGSALARLRTAPMEDASLPHERNPRIVQQFGTLCDCVAICSGRRGWTDSEVNLCRKILRSSLPTKTRMLLDYLSACSFSKEASRQPTASTAAKVIGVYRTSNVESQLRQWLQAGIVTSDNNCRYRMRPDTLDMYVDLGIIIKPKSNGLVVRRTINFKGNGKATP